MSGLAAAATTEYLSRRDSMLKIIEDLRLSEEDTEKYIRSKQFEDYVIKRLKDRNKITRDKLNA